MNEVPRVTFALSFLAKDDKVEIWEGTQEVPDRVGVVLRGGERPWLAWRKGEGRRQHDVQLIGGLSNIADEALCNEILPDLFTPGLITLGEGRGCCFVKARQRGDSWLSRRGIVVQRLRVVRSGVEVHHVWASE